MSNRTSVLLWAQKILQQRDAPPHTLLEVRAEATADQVSDAFQKIARMAHPDLHRSTLDPQELEMVTSAYGKVAGAYQELRTERVTTTKMVPITAVEPAPSTARPRPAAQTKPQSPPAGVPVAGHGGPSSGAASHSMNSKALIYYRKAELALRRGDLGNAVLQMKMAIAADSASTFLRAALTEIQNELAKKP